MVFCVRVHVYKFCYSKKTKQFEKLFMLTHEYENKTGAQISIISFKLPNSCNPEAVKTRQIYTYKNRPQAP